jgi:hypothetical protein
MAILLHPNLTMRKYHDGDGEPAWGWTATCVRDELARRRAVRQRRRLK